RRPDRDLQVVVRDGRAVQGAGLRAGAVGPIGLAVNYLDHPGPPTSGGLLQPTNQTLPPVGVPLPPFAPLDLSQDDVRHDHPRTLLGEDGLVDRPVQDDAAALASAGGAGWARHSEDPVGLDEVGDGDREVTGWLLRSRWGYWCRRAGCIA